MTNVDDEQAWRRDHPTFWDRVAAWWLRRVYGVDAASTLEVRPVRRPTPVEMTIEERATMPAYQVVLSGTPQLNRALVDAHSILSLLHHRGLVDSRLNRDDVAQALENIRPFARIAEEQIMTERRRDGG